MPESVTVPVLELMLAEPAPRLTEGSDHVPPVSVAVPRLAVCVTVRLPVWPASPCLISMLGNCGSMLRCCTAVMSAAGCQLEPSQRKNSRVSVAV